MAVLVFAALIFAVGWLAFHAGVKTTLAFIAGVAVGAFFFHKHRRQ